MTTVRAIDFTATLRPVRRAYLVPANVGLKWVSDEVIPYISCTWGGAYSFVFPIFDSLEAHPTFEKFLGLLTKFDPDHIMSAGAFPDALLGLISSRLLTQDKVFQYNPFHVRLPTMGHLRTTVSMPAEIVWEQKTGINLSDSQPTGDDLFDLLYFSRAGRLGKYVGDVAANNVKFTANPIQRAAVENNLPNFYSQSDSEWPMSASMTSLGGRGVTDHYLDYELPDLIVVGDTVEDWALFQSLQYMRTKIYWFPASLIGKNPASEFDQQLHRFHSRAPEQERIYTSASLAENSIQSLIERHVAGLPGFLSYDDGFEHRIELEFNDLIDNWLTWGEPNNFIDEALFFQDGLSLQFAPKLMPKQFTVPQKYARFVVDLIPAKYCFLAHSLCKFPPVEWRKPGAVTDEDNRRTIEGGVAFNPVSHLTYASQSLESTLVSPRVKMIDLMSDLTRIVESVGRIPKESEKSKVVQSTLHLWKQGVAAFCFDVVQDGSKEIFTSFKVGVEVAKKTLLTKEFGIGLRGEVLLSMPLTGGFTSGLPTVTDERVRDWFDNEILLRGLVLNCAKCGHRDFYQESEFSNRFRCKKCTGESDLKTPSFRSTEPRFLYRLNPLISALQREDSDVVVWAVHCLSKKVKSHFEWTSEVELYEKGRSVQEIDLIANVDGKLVLGEAKSNGSLTGAQLAAFVQLCKRLNVEQFVCATLGKWSVQSKTAIERAFLASPLTKIQFIEGP